MRPRLAPSGHIRIVTLRRFLAEMDDALIVRVGEDGHVYLAHQFTPDRPTLRIRLDDPEPRLERVAGR